MSRRRLPLLVLVAALLLAVFALARQQWVRPIAEASAPPSAPPSDATAVGSRATQNAGAVGAEPVPLRRLRVTVYFPSATLPGLVGDVREIFETATPGDRIKQILADLISGPQSDDMLRVLPASTRLRQVYVLRDGTAYLDFSQDLRQSLGGGSSDELLAVYSIVDSVTVNVPEIRRVGILIDGQSVETLGGHVDLRRPLPPDLSLIEGATARDAVLGPPPRAVRARAA